MNSACMVRVLDRKGSQKLPLSSAADLGGHFNLWLAGICEDLSPNRALWTCIGEVPGKCLGQVTQYLRCLVILMSPQANAGTVSCKTS
jgi:hypothetical protein